MPSRRFAGVLLGVAALLGGPVAAAEELPVLEKEIPLRGEVVARQYHLRNGLTVVLTPNPAAPLVSIYHWVKAGSLHETPGATGMAHLFEHMMFRPVRPGRPGFWAELARLGGKANADTRFYATVYTTTVPPARLAEALKLESERFRKMRVSDRLLKAEREAVRSEYVTKIDANPWIDLWDTIYRIGFPGHPYGWMVIGAREDLDRITAADCNGFFARTYLPNNTGLFVSGSFSPEVVLRWIADAYGGWKPGTPTVLPPPFEGPGKPVLATGKLPAASRELLVGYRTPEPDGHNHRVMTVANHVLFGSDYSLARRRLRDGRKLVADIDDAHFEYDSGMLKATAVLLPGVEVAAVIDQIGALADDFAALGPDELQAYLREYQLRRAEETLRNEALNEALALHWGKYGDVQALAEATRAPLHASKDEVLGFLRSFLVKSNLVAVVNRTEASQ